MVLVNTFTTPRKENSIILLLSNLHIHALMLTSLKWSNFFCVVGFSMLCKKILKVAPPTIQKFDLEDLRKLVIIAAASEMTREYLIKQKILPEHINI